MRSIFITLLVLSSLGSFAQKTPANASASLDSAYAKAKTEHKNVILIFHASWCGWCHKMKKSINDSTCKQLFNDNYVITYLDVMEHAGKEQKENPGGMDVMKKYGGDKSGLPFWVILNAKGKLLGNSLMPADGEKTGTAADNIGCPAADKELAYFINLLKSTSPLNDEQLAIIKTRFQKNNPATAAAN